MFSRALRPIRLLLTALAALCLLGALVLQLKPAPAAEPFVRCPDSNDVYVEKDGTKLVYPHPECWSGNVCFPKGKRGHLQPTSCVEYLLSSGKIVRSCPGSNAELGGNGICLRIRGTGQVSVWIE